MIEAYAKWIGMVAGREVGKPINIKVTKEFIGAGKATQDVNAWLLLVACCLRVYLIIHYAENDCQVLIVIYVTKCSVPACIRMIKS